MKKYAMVVIVEVEDGVNDSKGTATNAQKWVSKVLGANMGHQRDRGIPVKVKGVQTGKATRIAL